MNQNKDADKLSVGVTEFVVGSWFVIKLRGIVLIVVEKNRWRRRNERGRKECCSSCHKLNITDGFTNGFNRWFKFIDSFVCKNDIIILFCYFFIFFSTIYTDRVFTSVFIDWYYKVIFSRKNSPQSINENILSMWLFVITNFLIVTSHFLSCLLYL